MLTDENFEELNFAIWDAKINEIRGVSFYDSIISEKFCRISFCDWLQIGKYKVAEFNFVSTLNIKMHY